ncbi:MAG: hypothetical protein ACR2QZ_03725 [Woeseiaceae bacterium]
MGEIIAITSVLLALVAAGCIGYIAWELTSEETGTDNPDDSDVNGSPNED